MSPMGQQESQKDSNRKETIEGIGTQEHITVENMAEFMTTPEDTMCELSLNESDYDAEPTLLYSSLQKKQWAEAMAIIESTPNEARTWVYRKEAKGTKIRWRLLPLHGAIIFQAPAEVVESLLLIFPEGASERDDEGSLPIHLAYKRGAAAAVCKLLLEAFPNSIDIADRKGRTPKHLAATSTGPKHREFVFAMKNHLLALRAARVAARAEERAKFGQKLEQFKNEHLKEVAAIEEQKCEELAKLQERNMDLENELLKTQEASQVLVDHVADLEEQLAEKEQAEQELQGKVEEENKMKDEVNELNEQLESMQEQVNQLLLEKDVLNESLDQVVAAAEMEKKALEDSNAIQEKEISDLRQENEKAQSDIVLLKAQIEERQNTEKALSVKFEALDLRHLEHIEKTESITKKHTEDFEKVAEERDILKNTVRELTEKLQQIDTCLEGMVEEQNVIVREAELQEAEMAVVAKEHARILEEVSRQQANDAKAQEARDVIDALIQAQEEAYLSHTESRKKIVDSIDLHAKKAEESSRKKLLVQNVEALQDKIQKTRERVVGGLSEDVVTIVPEEKKSFVGAEDVQQQTEQSQEEERESTSEVHEESTVEEVREELEAPKVHLSQFEKTRKMFEEEKKMDDEDELHAEDSRVLSAFV